MRRELVQARHLATGDTIQVNREGYLLAAQITSWDFRPSFLNDRAVVEMTLEDADGTYLQQHEPADYLILLPDA